MNQLDNFATWFDARQAASEASGDYGFAWVVHAGRYGWLAVPGESLDDAPRAYDAEFAGGMQQ